MTEGADARGPRFLTTPQALLIVGLIVSLLIVFVIRGVYFLGVCLIASHEVPHVVAGAVAQEMEPLAAASAILTGILTPVARAIGTALELLRLLLAG